MSSFGTNRLLDAIVKQKYKYWNLNLSVYTHSGTISDGLLTKGLITIGIKVTAPREIYTTGITGSYN